MPRTDRSGGGWGGQYTVTMRTLHAVRARNAVSFPQRHNLPRTDGLERADQIVDQRFEILRGSFAISRAAMACSQDTVGKSVRNSSSESPASR